MSNFGEQIRKFLPWFFLVELVSYLGYYWPSVNTAGFVLCLLVAVYFAYRNFDYLVAFLLAELVIGSKGHLFVLSIGTFDVSVRIMIWTVVIFSWLIFSLVKIYKSKSRSAEIASIIYPKAVRIFLPLILFVVLGIVVGLVNSNQMGNIYADANAWLYFFLIWPFSYLVQNMSKQKLLFYIQIISLSIIWLVIKTWLILYFFSHEFIIIGDFYKWIRDSGVGEITAMNGSFYRIFIQSHVYILMALVISWYYLAREVVSSHNLRSLINSKTYIRLVLLSSSLFSVILIGLSRSFWVGLFVGLLAISAVMLITNKDRFAKKLQKYVFFSSSLLISLFVSLFIILLIIKIPFPNKLMEFDAATVLTERVTETNESAIGSRWAMLPILTRAISQDIFLGHGFGTTATYQSQDPRVIERTGGIYTTFAFEWGWLDIWLKIGLFGLLAYIYLLLELWLLAGNTPFVGPIRLLLLTLAALHVFTPYLNHPLGIGLLLMVVLLEFSHAEALPNKLKEYILHFINFKFFKS